MARGATKAVGNCWYEARMRAAQYDDRLMSREGAAELLGMSVSSVADAELGLTKVMPADKAVLMADLYNAPELLHHYCMNECPIGGCMQLSDAVNTIDRITVKLLNEVKKGKLKELRDKLLKIASDGVISDDEIADVEEVMKFVSMISKTASELKIVCEKAMKD